MWQRPTGRVTTHLLLSCKDNAEQCWPPTDWCTPFAILSINLLSGSSILMFSRYINGCTNDYDFYSL